MKNLAFRTLNADEIDVRVSTIKKDGSAAMMLLYKDARVDQNILDETVGQFNWQRTHSRDNANCTVSLWDEDKGQWIAKEDTGTESFSEAEKGLASDSFKRACFNWGIGRELYTAPTIWITKLNGEDLKYVRLKVKSIDYDEKRRITSLVLIDSKGNTRYSYGMAGNMTIKEVATALKAEVVDTTEKAKVLGLVAAAPDHATLTQLISDYKQFGNDTDFKNNVNRRWKETK